MKWFVTGFFCVGVALLIYNNLPRSTTAPQPANPTNQAKGPTSPNTVPSPQPPNRTPTSPQSEDKRPITYYSAKSALARLALYLRENGYPPVKGIWNAVPASSALYQYNLSLRRSVGGWMFIYVDAQGKSRSATANSWGEVSIKDFSATESNAFSSREIYPRAINVDEFVLDNTDANTVVLNRGGEAKSDGLGGWLMAAEVEGRGIRPLWAGSEWFTRKEGTFVMVDTQTGELYHPISEKKMQPLAAGQKQPEAQWDGGFDATSPTSTFCKADSF